MSSLIPPWATTALWYEANHWMDFHIDRYCQELEPARQQAAQIQDGLLSIFPVMEELCTATCTSCPDPCCLKAKVWIDFRDLLFLHLSGQSIPRVQLLKDHRSPCVYCTPKGCALPRLLRPWICTWYLCPEQTLKVGHLAGVNPKDLNSTLQSIRHNRIQMEDEFIRVVSENQ